ncbi:hypothetical protein KDI_39700 [Dictyobacter arantiisoli]|uniref:Uncharacterized protein n=1 Tax=Dictyobacter arantiisoli TaxID=2014874 RepID=A0A5A5TGX7_9CHLR|nr:hypothetical protein KDI_39700 [Dictyobacter arantiisoli]
MPTIIVTPGSNCEKRLAGADYRKFAISYQKIGHIYGEIGFTLIESRVIFPGIVFV